MIRSGVFSGSTVRVTVRFTDPDTGLPIDVDEPVTFEVRPPANDDGTLRDVITGTGLKVSTGAYQTTFVAEYAGRYALRGSSAAPDPAVAYNELEVRSAAV